MSIWSGRRNSPSPLCHSGVASAIAVGFKCEGRSFVMHLDRLVRVELDERENRVAILNMAAASRPPRRSRAAELASRAMIRST